MFHLLLAIIYLAFISLGLPDGLLGSAWPSMYQEFQVPVSYAGIISMIISGGTIVSSLQSDRLTLHLGPGKVTALSVAMTAAALFGFSFSHSFLPLCLWAVPYGLGAGSVDAALNNYVALHYTSRHMSWLHCMWGVGASAGPYIMGSVLSGGASWNTGYRYIGILQVTLTAILFLSLPLWKTRNVSGAASGSSSGAAIDKDAAEVVDTAKAAYTRKPLSLGQILRIPGAREVMVAFFCYCALEQTTGLWASSYLALHEGISSETAAFYASLFFIGITAGRAASGFLTLRFSDTQMIRLGQGIILLGILISAILRDRFAGRTYRDRSWMCAYISMYHPLHTCSFRCGSFPGRNRRTDGLGLCRLLPDAANIRTDSEPHQHCAFPAIFAGDSGSDVSDA